MLGLVLIYFIGKKFYELADSFDKHKWKYTILGLLSYYGTIFLIQIIAGFIYYILNPEKIDLPDDLNSGTEMAIGLISIPFGIVACYFLYKNYSKKWKAEVVLVKDEIQNIGKDIV